MCLYQLSGSRYAPCYEYVLIIDNSTRAQTVEIWSPPPSLRSGNKANDGEKGVARSSSRTCCTLHHK